MKSQDHDLKKAAKASIKKGLFGFSEDKVVKAGMGQGQIETPVGTTALATQVIVNPLTWQQFRYFS